jgi:hypothetical protein
MLVLLMTQLIATVKWNTLQFRVREVLASYLCPEINYSDRGGAPQSFQAHAGIVSQNTPQPLLSICLPVYYAIVILLSDAV